MAVTATSTGVPRVLPDARAGDAPDGDALAFRAPRRAELLRRLRLPLGAAGVLVAAALLLGVPVDPVVDVARRLLAADHGWLLVAAALEAASFAGYVVLLWAIAGRAAPRFGVREAYRTTVAGAAATRLLPTAGAGGAALTLWVLRRAGLRDDAGPRTLLTFLVVLYSVFLVAVAGAGVAASLGGHVAVGAPAAAFGLGAIGVALWLGRRAATAGDDASQHVTAAPAMRTSMCNAPATQTSMDAPRGGVEAGTHRVRDRARETAAGARRGMRTLGPAIADAGRLVRDGRDPRLLGALTWWACDVAVLGAALHAVGASLAIGTLVLAYVLGQVANTLPLPGAASSGLVGVLILLGTAPALAVAAVLCYRVVAIWLPAPAGALALVGLRRSVARWGAEDAPRPVVACPAHAPQPLAA